MSYSGKYSRLVVALSPRFAVATLAVATICWGGSVFGQEATSRDGQPLEYIESSSPIPGGGTVSSVYVPGQSGPVYRQVPKVDVGNSVAGNPSGQAGVAERSVLSPSLGQRAVAESGQGFNSMGQQPTQGPQAVVARRQQAYQQPMLAPAQPVLGYQVPAASQIPSLGVPTNWNRAIRQNNCAGCGPGAGYAPYGLGQPPASPPGYFPGQGSVAQTFSAAPQPAFGQAAGRANYTPLVRLQSFPPNAYAGQGIIGSPKLYVDGQPIRNLMRYLWIP